MAQTVGEVVEQRGPCELMALVVELAEAYGHLPVGHWTIDLEPGWQLTVNGTKDEIDHVPPWHAMMTRRGFPVVIFDSADGTAMWQGEDEAIAVLQRAVAAQRAVQS